jgi:hypothetical protein
MIGPDQVSVFSRSTESEEVFCAIAVQLAAPRAPLEYKGRARPTIIQQAQIPPRGFPVRLATFTST